MNETWPQAVAWPSAALLRELRDKAHTYTVETITNPVPELAITEESLRGHQLQDLVIEFSGLSIRLDAGRRGYYYRVVHHIGPARAGRPMLPLFVYAVDLAPDGEFEDEYFNHF